MSKKERSSEQFELLSSLSPSLTYEDYCTILAYWRDNSRRVMKVNASIVDTIRGMKAKLSEDLSDVDDITHPLDFKQLAAFDTCLQVSLSKLDFITNRCELLKELLSEQGYVLYQDIKRVTKPTVINKVKRG